jgi:hypothetical protein
VPARFNHVCKVKAFERSLHKRLLLRFGRFDTDLDSMLIMIRLIKPACQEKRLVGLDWFGFGFCSRSQLEKTLEVGIASVGHWFRVFIEAD